MPSKTALVDYKKCHPDKCDSGACVSVLACSHKLLVGTPVAYDGTLATAFGAGTFELIENKKYGKIASLHGNRITEVPLAQAAEGTKTVNLNIYEVAEKLLG